MGKANVMFTRGMKGEKFNFGTCHSILAGKEKWKLRLLELKNKAAKDAEKAERVAQAAALSLAGRSAGVSVEEEVVEAPRPIGRKQAKALAQIEKRKLDSSLALATSESMMEFVAINKKKAKLMQEALDKSYMDMDLSLISDPRRRAFYERKQNEVMDRDEGLMNQLALDDNVEDSLDEVELVNE